MGAPPGHFAGFALDELAAIAARHPMKKSAPGYSTRMLLAIRLFHE
jgi:hypothetical protein